MLEDTLRDRIARIIDSDAAYVDNAQHLATLRKADRILRELGLDGDEDNRRIREAAMNGDVNAARFLYGSSEADRGHKNKKHT